VVIMTKRRGLPHTFGWLKLINAGDVRRDQLPAINRTPTELDLGRRRPARRTGSSRAPAWNARATTTRCFELTLSRATQAGVR
jgi:hypothetical protein